LYGGRGDAGRGVAGRLLLLASHRRDREEVRDCALAGLETISLAADVDAVALQHLERYFVLTSLVSLHLPEENVLERPAGAYQAVFAGYMLLFYPLPIGPHVIHLHDEFADGFASDVTYHVTVAGT